MVFCSFLSPSFLYFFKSLNLVCFAREFSNPLILTNLFYYRSFVKKKKTAVVVRLGVHIPLRLTSRKQRKKRRRERLFYFFPIGLVRIGLGPSPPSFPVIFSLPLLQFQLTSFLQSSFPVTSHHIVRSRCQDLIAPKYSAAASPVQLLPIFASLARTCVAA